MIKSAPIGRPSMAIAVVITLLAGLGIFAPWPSADADEAVAAAGARLAVEVAEDGTRFVFADEPVLDNDYPAYGNPFVTQGYIYPAGTLTDSNGVNADGSPEFPDEVIGEWTCWGYFIGDGANTTEGAWVITTQVFEFDGDVPGEHTIVTVGPETPAGAGPAVRSVTGGTGDYAGVSGQTTQVTLGHNVSDGVNATFAFDIRGGRPDQKAQPSPLGFRDVADVVRTPR